MEITRSIVGGRVELCIQGRLDGYWADHLGASLADAIREGHDRICLDLSKVAFMSSAGIAVLMKFYKQLKRIDGQLVVVRPSDQVRTVLQISRLTDVLIEADAPAAATAGVVAAAPSAAAQAVPVAAPLLPRSMEWAGTAVQVYDVAPGATLRGRTVGSEAPLAAGAFEEAHCTSLQFPESAFAFGVGAIGGSFTECRERFGEFLGVGGAAAYLPADGTSVPDYVVGSAAGAPRMQVLYGLTAEGRFARVLRFDAASSGGGVIGLSDLAACALDLSKSDAAGVVIVAEAAGLVGAALRRSPALQHGDLFAHPGIRAHLTFTAERAYPRSLTIATGIVSRRPQVQLRPLGGAPDLHGHFHAAAFTFGPLKKGPIGLEETVTHLFETESLLGVLHLLNDDRKGAGVGQSEFIRGACWTGPVDGAWEGN
jgi:anti-anti-sigma factor